MFLWESDDLTTGLYEHRTRIQADGDIVLRDTSYAVVVRDGPNRPSLGTTGSEGAVSTTERAWFPALYDVPPIEIRDEEAIRLGMMEVSPTVAFVVTVDGEKHTFRRTVSEGENTLTLTISP